MSNSLELTDPLFQSKYNSMINLSRGSSNPVWNRLKLSILPARKRLPTRPPKNRPRLPCDKNWARQRLWRSRSSKSQRCSSQRAKRSRRLKRLVNRKRIWKSPRRKRRSRPHWNPLRKPRPKMSCHPPRACSPTRTSRAYCSRGPKLSPTLCQRVPSSLTFLKLQAIRKLWSKAPSWIPKRTLRIQSKKPRKMLGRLRLTSPTPRTRSTTSNSTSSSIDLASESSPNSSKISSTNSTLID